MDLREGLALELPLLEDIDILGDGLSFVDGDARAAQLLGFNRVIKDRTPSKRVARN